MQVSDFFKKNNILLILVDFYLSYHDFFCCPDPDERFLKWIRIRQNDTDPTQIRNTVMTTAYLAQLYCMTTSKLTIGNSQFLFFLSQCKGSGFNPCFGSGSISGRICIIWPDPDPLQETWIIKITKVIRIGIFFFKNKLFSFIHMNNKHINDKKVVLSIISLSI